MFKGATVFVIKPSDDRDEFDEPVESEVQPEQVDNVLIAPGKETLDMDEKRPSGDKTWLTLHFPKSYKGSLRGCQIDVGGQIFDVVGDPQPYMEQNTPGAWNRPVEVVRYAG